MKNIKLIEWNINKRSTNTPCKEYICNRILNQNADIICLTEYLEDELIKRSLNEAYWITESICSQGNQILIAIKKSLSKEKPIIIKNNDEPNCYNFLHIRLKRSIDKYISIIGMRMLTGEGKNAINAEIQTPPLNKYLKNIKESFICVGDFNIREYRIGHWFPNYNIHEIRSNNSRIEEYSYLFPKESFVKLENAGALDHIISNKMFKITSKYNWDFLCDNEIYPNIEDIERGCYWNIPLGYPDHGMLISEIEFVDNSINNYKNMNNILR